MKKSIFLLIVLVSSLVNAQEIKDYKWDEKPVFQSVPEQFQKEQAVVLFDKRWIHTRVGMNSFASFIMNHFAIKINTQDAINKYNKVKAENAGYVRDLRDFHARVIKPDGTIKVLPASSIVEREIEKVKSIVFEGVSAGDILEYYFILKENPTVYGVEIYQKDIPVLEASFTTSNSGARFFVYHHKLFSEAEIDNKMVYSAKNIPAIKEEWQSNETENLVKIIYNLVVNSQKDYYEWEATMESSFKKPEFYYFKKKHVRELITKLQVENQSVDEQITKIDNYIKENFEFVSGGETAKDIPDLTAGKQKLNASDIFDLYGYMFKELKIKYKIACGLDKEYGSINFDRRVRPLPHDFLYFITETKKFLSPYERYLPYGLYPQYELQKTTGITYDPESEDIGRIVFPEAPSDYTVIKTDCTLTLNTDLTAAELEKTSSSTGYTGQIERNYIKYLQGNEEKKVLVDFLKSRHIDDLEPVVGNYYFENQEFKNSQNNTPFIISQKVEIKSNIVENAGNLLIINLGKVIGKQNNLYQINERFTDIHLNYNKTFQHKITFTIPPGYALESYSDLIKNQNMKGDLNNNCSFKSTVKENGQTIVVEVIEKYNSIFYTKDEYQEYRKIVNTAADFSKATLVLKQLK